jgi:hypothetical protein
VDACLQFFSNHPHWQWRFAYFIEAAAVAPSLLTFAQVRGPASMQEINADFGGKTPDTPSDSASAPSTTHSKFEHVKKDLTVLAKNRVYVLIVLGYAMQTFFVGAVAIFGIQYMVNVSFWLIFVRVCTNFNCVQSRA